ncbi:four helix bundle protein [Achromobacter pestifer]
MAIHTDLPVYKLACDLLDTVSDLTLNMPRHFGRTFGGRINGECIEILVLIGRANAARDKVPYLDELLERKDVMAFLLRLALNKQYLSPKQYARVARLCDRVGQQVGGWRRHSARSASAA